MCANRKCIPQQWTCDGINHCGDQSDEDDMAPTSSPGRRSRSLSRVRSRGRPGASSSSSVILPEASVSPTIAQVMPTGPTPSDALNSQLRNETIAFQTLHRECMALRHTEQQSLAREQSLQAESAILRDARERQLHELQAFSQQVTVLQAGHSSDTISAQKEITSLKTQLLQREAAQQQNSTIIHYEQSEVLSLRQRLSDEEQIASSHKGQLDQLITSTRLQSDRSLSEANAKHSQFQADSAQKYALVEAEASQFKQALIS